MKNHLFLILFFIIISCKKAEELNLNLNVDPLIEAYKKNNVDYYLKSIVGKDTIYYKDSTCVNENGMVTLKKTMHGHQNLTSNRYDKFNRIVETEHVSDIQYRFKTVYLYDENSKSLTSSHFLYNSNRKSFSNDPSSMTYHKFLDGKLISDITIDTESKDTVMITSYKYTSKNKIAEISKNNLANAYKQQTKFKYRTNNTLSEIIDDQERQVKYISERTGLVDSVNAYSGEKTIYNYHFRE